MAEYKNAANRLVLDFNEFAGCPGKIRDREVKTSLKEHMTGDNAAARGHRTNLPQVLPPSLLTTIFMYCVTATR